jgi:SEC-C motif-containing protein
MSFGRAAASGRPNGFPHPEPDLACPCGEDKTFATCCAPVLAGERAVAPEQLMRSRYTAFVVGDARHLLSTWHPGTRPESVDLDPSLRWTGLEIVDAPAVEPEARRAVVEFRARWREGSSDGSLHERSRFVNQSGSWWYLDGDVST